MTSKPLELATGLAARGFRVFPLAAGSKVPPAGLAWQSVATSDPFGVELAFWGHKGNAGVATGAGLIVIDIDAHKGGETTAAGLELPDTFAVSTPRGGRHLYYSTIEPFSNGVEAIGPGVDVRGEGGYVVAPGSEWSGKRYEIICDVPLAPLPEALAARLKKSRTRSVAPGATVGELDTPEAIERARAYLRGAPPAAEGSRNASAYKHAAKTYDFGLTPGTCFDLVSECWNVRNAPPLDDDELRRTTDSAATSRQNAIGSDNPAAGLSEIEEAPSAGPDADSQRLFEPVTDWVGAEPPPPASFVVAGLVPRGFVTILVSAGGRGKSMLAQTMITAVASGRPFLGLPTEQGFAAGMFCEDETDELRRRQKRICRAVGVDFQAVAPMMAPRSWVDGGSDTLLWQDNGKVAGPTDLLRQFEREAMSRPDFGLLVIDNVSFVFGGAEIDRGQVTRFLAALTRLASRAKIGIVLIAHESKSSAASDTHAVSGSTAWINAVRSVLKLEKVDGDTDARILKHIKTNRGALARDIYFSMSTGAPVLREAAPLECKEATLRLVRAAIERRENLSPNKQASNYAARVLAQCDPKFTVGDYEAALAALVSDGALRVDRYQNKGQNPERYAVATVAPEPSASGGPDGFRRLDEEPSEHCIC